MRQPGFLCIINWISTSVKTRPRHFPALPALTERISGVKISKKFFSFTGLLLAATLVLGACGEDSATATPVPATATTAPTTVASATSAAATSGTDSTPIPAISGTTEVQTDASISAAVATQLGIPTLGVKLFTSNDDATKVGDAADAALTGSGYAFGIPGVAKPVTQNGSTVGLYSKSGSSDILFTAVAVPANTADVGTSIPGLDAASAQKFADQLKGKKTLLVVMTGPGLLQALVKLGSSSSSPTAASGTVAAATPTVAGATLPASTTAASGTAGGTTAAATTAASGSGTTAATGTATDVIAYTNATAITLPDSLQGPLVSGLSQAKNAKLNGFSSSDAPSVVKGGIMNSYTQAGWTDATAVFTGATDALSKLGPDAFFVAYTKDNKISFVLGLSGYTAGLLGVTGADSSGTVYIVGSGEK